MARRESFSFRLHSREREMLARLADQLQRSQGDTVRLLVREATEKLNVTEKNEQSDLAKHETLWKKARTIILHKGTSIFIDVLKAFLIEMSKRVFLP